jgi:ABC-type dipeptide/oligopeptide/nickel transport system permease component
VDILNFLRKRFIHMIPVLFGIVLVVFLMVRLIPGDPARIMLGTHATPERLSELRAELGLDEPIWRQFLLFMGNVVQGDLGTSLVYRRSVFDVILDRLPPTLFLITYAAIMSLALTIPLALVAAVRQNSLPDQSVRVGSTMALSMPSFWLGLNLLVIFAVRLRWFPVAGYGEDFLDRVWHLFLPALTITLAMAPILIRSLRSGLIDVLRAPYVEFARAKGIRETRVLHRHVLRNAMISTVTILGLNIGWLMGGSVVIETVFSIPGLGSLMVSSIFARDYPVIQGVTLIFGFLVIMVNLLTDVVYSALDPRVTYD